MFPLPSERITVLKHGDRFDLGEGIIIEVIDALGHAPHHLCFFERSRRALFCGDAAGIHRGEIRVPATVLHILVRLEMRSTYLSATTTSCVSGWKGFASFAGNSRMRRSCGRF